MDEIKKSSEKLSKNKNNSHWVERIKIKNDAIEWNRGSIIYYALSYESHLG